MRSSYGHSGVSPPVLIRDPLAEDLDVFGRHSKARVSPRAAARAADGKALVQVWPRCGRSL
jgi:hypothetical protein